MGAIHPILQAFLPPVETDIEKMHIPKAFVEKMLETNSRIATAQGHSDERKEIVCRLLGSGMSVDEISLILKIRTAEITEIERYNHDVIADYGKKLKARRRSRERSK